MSTTIDERVVEMRFDNKNFEKNAEQSLDTIEKLKKSLDFSDSGKSLESLEKSFGKFNLDGIGNAVESIASKFTNLGIIGRRVLENLTDKAVNFVTSTAKSMTMIDQMAAGWGKYADKTSAVQTIMSATGDSMEYVNQQLDKLNWFTDETSYNFIDMVNNIGKFTSAGVDLETATTAMMGIANWAAVSGAGIQGASHAMYNLSQAMGVGAVKLMDWKSIENANMATMEFKDTALQTAAAMGQLTDLGNGLYETLDGKATVSVTDFTDSLKQEWFTADVLIETLRQYGGIWDGMYEEYITTGKSATDQLGEMGDATTDLGIKSAKAAQEAKTFRDAIDSVKDAVSTGWAKTFELIFGDYEKAKGTWTNFANDLWDIFASGGEIRNERIAELNSTSWDELTARINEAGIATEDFEAKIYELAKHANLPIDTWINEYGSLNATFQNGWFTGKKLAQVIRDLKGDISNIAGEAVNASIPLEEVSELVNSVWRGEWGNGHDRVEALEAAGWNYDQIQGLLNKVINGYKITDADAAEVFNTLRKTSSLTEEEIQSSIDALEKMAQEAENTDSELNKLLKDSYKKGAIDLTLEGFGNVLKTIAAAISNVRESFREMVPYTDVKKIRDAAEAFRDFTARMLETVSNGDLVQAVLKGVFGIIGVGKRALESVLILLRPIGAIVTLLIDKIMSIGGKVVSWFIDAISSTGILTKGFNKLNDILTKFTNSLIRLIKGDINFTYFKNRVIEGFKDLVENTSILSPKVKKIFIDLADSMKNTGNKLISWTSEFFPKIKKFGKNSLSSAKNLTSTFFNTFVNAWNDMDDGKTVFEKIKVSFAAGFDSVKDTVSNKIAQWKEKLQNGLSIKDIYEIVKTKLINTFTTIKNWIVEKYDSLHIPETLENIGKNFSEAFTWLGEKLTKAAEFAKKIFEKVPGVIEFILGGLESLSKSVAILRITSFLKSLSKGQQLLVAGVTAKIADIGKFVSDFSTAFIGIFKSVSGLFDTIGNGVMEVAKGIKKNFKAKAFKETTKGLLILVAAVGGIIGLLYLMKKYPLDVASETFKQNAIAVGVVTATLLGIVTVISLIGKIGGQLGGFNILATVLALIGFIGAIALLFKTIKKINDYEFGKLNWKNIGTVLVGTIISLVELFALAVIGLGKPMKAVFSLMIFCGAILMLMKTIKKINKFKMGKFKLGNWIELGLAIAGMTKVVSVIAKASRGSSAVGAAASLIIMCGAIIAIIKTIKKINDTEFPKKWNDDKFKTVGMAVLAIGVLTALMGFVTRGSKPLASAAAIVVMCVAIGMVTRAIKNIVNSDLDLAHGNIWKVVTVFGSLIVLGGMLKILSGIKLLQAIKVLVTYVIMLYTLKLVMKKINEITDMSINYTNLGAVMGVFVVLGGIAAIAGIGGIHLVKGAIKSLISYGLMALALRAVLWGIKPICEFMEGVNWETLGKVGAVIAGLGVIAGIAGAFAGPMALGALALGLVGAVVDGLIWLTGKVTGTFADGLASLSDSMDKMADTMPHVASGIDSLNTINNADSALENLKTIFSQTLWNGLISSIVDMSGLTTMADGMKQLFGNIPQISSDIDTLNSIVDVDSAFVTLKKIFNKTDWQAVVASIIDFTNLQTMAESMSTLFGTIPDIGTGIDSLNSLTDVETAMGNLKTIFGKLTWESLLTDVLGTDFTKLGELATGLITVFDNTPKLVEGINSLNTISKESITLAMGNIEEIAKSANALASDGFLGLGTSDNENLIEMAGVLVTLGEAFGKFADEFTKLDSISVGVFVENMTSLLGLDFEAIKEGLNKISLGIKSLNENSFEDHSREVGDYTAALEEMSKIGDVIVDASSRILDSMTSLGANMVSNLANGMDRMIGTVRGSASNVSSAAYNGANSYTSSFYNIGANMGQGLANGISSKAGVVRAAAHALANIAKQETENTLGIASPSKVAYKIGEFWDQGLIDAMYDGEDDVESAAEEVAQKVTSFTEMAINAIKDILESGDMEPTITPVLDLSNVRANVGRLGSMLPASKSSVILSSQVSKSNDIIQNAKNNAAYNANVPAPVINPVSASVNPNWNVSVNFEGSLAQLAHVLHPAIRFEENRIGPNIVKG